MIIRSKWAKTGHRAVLRRVVNVPTEFSLGVVVQLDI